MKKRIFQTAFLLLLTLTLLLICASCGHEHEFGEWSVEKEATCTESGNEVRFCECGEKETIGIDSFGHKYNAGEIIKSATCIQEGTKRYSCTNSSCQYSYDENYSFPKYTANEIYNHSVKYVGEIATYDKKGSEVAIGTGFLISSDGRIVTNYHVIEGAYSAKITIDGRTYNIVSVLAYDKTIDLAVLKINASNLTAAAVCKNPVQIGETVYAIGSSRGMTNTYSQGIITYANRVVDGVSHVQHDASITHGNSGGPLINAYGEVIGINTWVISDSQNLNFAVFTKELDNLTYGTPLTIAELYLKECDVFEKLKNYIIDNGNYDYEDDCYYLTLGTHYSSDYSSKYTRRVYYYVYDNEITLDYITEGDYDYWVYFTIDENVDGSYYWCFFDEDEYEMSGTLYAATYDDNTLLGYSYNNFPSYIRTSVRELASVVISTLCLCIDMDFDVINVTAEDLGFYYY